MKYMKQFGLRRTGTNYIRRLIELNFNARVLVHQLGTKHTEPKLLDTEEYLNWLQNDNVVGKELFATIEEAEEFLEELKNGNEKYIICIKNPYSWISSYEKYNKIIYEHDLPIKGLDLNNEVSEEFKQAVERWNTINRKYLEFYANNIDKVFIIKYEDIIRDDELILKELEKKFELERNNKEFIKEEDYILPPCCKIPVKFDKDFYLKEKYMGKFSEEQLEYMRNNLDKYLMDYFEYEVR